MIAGDFRKGSTFQMDGKLYYVVDFQHHMQPRLAAFVRAKIKNIETGQVLEQRFNIGDKVDEIQVEKKEMQYLYSDGELYYFMDTETYEQIPLDKSIVEDALQYVMENGIVSVKKVKDKIISVEPPLFVDLEIVECEPGIAGDTTKNTTKPAKLETGLWIKVPLFVNNHEKVRVDTRTGEYMERI